MKKISTLIEEGTKIRQSLPSKALDIFTRALNESETESNEEFRTKSLFNIAITYLILGNYNKSISYFQDALDTSYGQSDPELQAEILRGIAGNNGRKYNYREALKYFYLAEEASIKCWHMENLHLVYQGMASLYTKINLNEKALSYTLKSLEIAEQSRDIGALQTSLMSIGACYYKLGNTEEARKYFEESLANPTQPFAEANALHFLSIMKYDEGSFDEADEMANRQIEICEKNNYYDFAALGYRLKGKTMFRKGKFEAALEFYEKGISVLNSVGDKNIKFSILKNIIDTYDKMGETGKITEMYGKLYKEHTSHLEKDIQVKIEQLDFETETELIKKEVEKERENNMMLKKALDDVHLLNDKLKVMHDEKNNLMSILAHDLKNPLQSILSSLKLMKNEKDDSEFREEMSENIREQSGRMLNLINRLLDYRAIESGSIKLNISSFEYETLISKLIKQANIHAVKKGITIFNNCSCGKLKIKSDAELFYQILENLLSNSIKFSPEGSRIQLKCSQHDLFTQFEIEDEGPGFSDDDIKKLYSNFAKLSAKPTGNEHSTGLGLSIVKKLCEILNAEIELKSVRNKGSKFIIKIRNS
ncbi:MAG: tetratricopeptide repeat protein [Ignavibacteria bacterium]|nr:tetratricopeptide repeat protein [Ignavibacteria bacterium]